MLSTNYMLADASLKASWQAPPEAPQYKQYGCATQSRATQFRFIVCFVVFGFLEVVFGMGSIVSALNNDCNNYKKKKLRKK